MSQVLLWKQIFSNYHNLSLPLNQEQRTSYLSNVSGNQLRVSLTNEFGQTPLTVTKISVSATEDFTCEQLLSLNGQQVFSIPAGETCWTDWISFDSKVSQSLYFSIKATNDSNGCFTLANTLDNRIVNVLQPLADEYPTFYFGIESIEVTTSASPKLLTFFGDSLTSQGYFTSELTRLLYKEFPNELTATNAGISGNRLLRAGNSISEWSDSFGEAGINRFKKDVLDFSPDIVFFLAGINDLFHPGAGSPTEELPTAKEIIHGIQSLQKLCEKNGAIFCPATLTPFKGSTNHGIPSWTPEKERIRNEVNQFILTLPHAIHLARFTCEEDLASLKKDFDSGDHLHFSSFGGKKIGAYAADSLAKLISQ